MAGVQRDKQLYVDREQLNHSNIQKELVPIGCLSIHGTHVIANNSTNNNAVFFFVPDLKLVYYNNY